jgi:proteasome lid subunit RPN8/RPN11
MQFPKMFSGQVEIDAKAHARRDWPRESVGFVVDGAYCPQVNESSDPHHHFAVSKESVLQASPGVQGVIHSHTNGRWEPSYQDQKTAIDWNLPFGLLTAEERQSSNILWWGTGVPIPPYEGRIYIPGVYDCIALVEHYYQQEYNISLPRLPHSETWWNKPIEEDPDSDMLFKNIVVFGFHEIDIKDIKPGDVLFFSVRSKYHFLNHSSIFLGGDVMLHHLTGMLSKTDQVSRWISGFKHIVIRHGALNNA